MKIRSVNDTMDEAGINVMGLVFFLCWFSMRIWSYFLRFWALTTVRPIQYITYARRGGVSYFYDCT